MLNGKELELSGQLIEAGINREVSGNEFFVSVVFGQSLLGVLVFKFYISHAAGIFVFVELEELDNLCHVSFP
ncbi:hypothetical protein D3C80_1508740 [compost metagenome]